MHAKILIGHGQGHAHGHEEEVTQDVYYIKDCQPGKGTLSEDLLA